MFFSNSGSTLSPAFNSSPSDSSAIFPPPLARQEIYHSAQITISKTFAYRHIHAPFRSGWPLRGFRGVGGPLPTESLEAALRAS